MNKKQVKAVLWLYGIFINMHIFNIISKQELLCAMAGLFSLLYALIYFNESDKDDDKPQSKCETKPQ